MTLFDADDYTAAGRAARKPRAKGDPKPPPEVVPIVIDERWRVIRHGQPGVIHAALKPTSITVIGQGERPDSSGGVVAYCGAIGARLTFTDGDEANGCAACFDEISAQAEAVALARVLADARRAKR